MTIFGQLMQASMVISIFQRNWVWAVMSACFTVIFEVVAGFACRVRLHINGTANGEFRNLWLHPIQNTTRWARSTRLYFWPVGLSACLTIQAAVFAAVAESRSVQAIVMASIAPVGMWGWGVRSRFPKSPLTGPGAPEPGGPM